MSGLAYTIPPAVAILVALWFLLRPRSSSSKKPENLQDGLRSLNVIPMHHRFFPQIRQALSEADDQYLNEAAPAHVARQARRERRAVARQFLFGLREDFSNLERLGRMIAALSPVISRHQETERITLSLKFQFFCALVWLRLSAGRIPIGQIQYLSGLVGQLAARMDQAITEINALSEDRVSGRVNA